MSDTNIKTNLVLCGGGIKGIAHIGVLFALKELGFLTNYQNFIGTLYLIGYSPAELYDCIKLLDLDKLKSINMVNIDQFGLDTGENYEYTIKRLIKNKGLSDNITLKEFYTKTNKKLILVSVCLNTTEVCYLSHETFPDLPLYLAIRMTTSIPLIYCPVIYEKRMYVDGACIDNYPISVFKDELNKTLGIFMVETPYKEAEILDLETFIFKILQCMMIGLFVNSKKGYENYTIEVDTGDVDFADYSITGEIKDSLFLEGYRSIMNNLGKLGDKKDLNNEINLINLNNEINQNNQINLNNKINQNNKNNEMTKE
jgi:NTE family protein